MIPSGKLSKISSKFSNLIEVSVGGWRKNSDPLHFLSASTRCFYWPSQWLPHLSKLLLTANISWLLISRWFLYLYQKHFPTIIQFSIAWQALKYLHFKGWKLSYQKSNMFNWKKTATPTNVFQLSNVIKILTSKTEPFIWHLLTSQTFYSSESMSKSSLSRI